MKLFDYLKNFGFENETEVVMPGTNAKMNEMQALMGCQVLAHMDGIISHRKAVDACYRKRLKDVPGIHIPQVPASNIEFNFAYFPVEIDAAEFGMDRDGLYKALQRFNIFARRYFYPLLTDFACYRAISVKDPLTCARKVAERILTLPIYDSLAVADVERICDCIQALSASRKSKKAGKAPVTNGEHRTTSRVNRAAANHTGPRRAV